MSNGRVVFTTKGDNRVWAFDPVAMALTIIYDDDVQVNGVLSGVDNVGTSQTGCRLRRRGRRQHADRARTRQRRDVLRSSSSPTSRVRR